MMDPLFGLKIAPLCCQVNPHLVSYSYPSNTSIYTKCQYCDLVMCKDCMRPLIINGNHMHPACYKLWQQDPKYQAPELW